jgi:hypothetical protein
MSRMTWAVVVDDDLDARAVTRGGAALDAGKIDVSTFAAIDFADIPSPWLRRDEPPTSKHTHEPSLDQKETFPGTGALARGYAQSRCGRARLNQASSLPVASRHAAVHKA